MQQFRTLLHYPYLISLVSLSFCVLISLLDYLLKQSLFHNKFPSFFIMMAFVNIIYFIGFYKNKSNHSKTLPDQQLIKKENNFLAEKGSRSSRICKGIIFYGFIYSFSNFAVPASAYSPTEKFLPSPNQQILLSNSFASSSQDNNLPFPIEPISHRLLEEATTSISRFSEDLFKTSDPIQDIRTLSIGKILSTLRLDPDSIIVSHDSKFAFIILKDTGTLKVIDISDDQNPTNIGSLELASLNIRWHHKKMILSADGKTIFATTIQYLEIIDVSDPQNPALITRLEDPLFSKLDSQNPNFCVPTMALSLDEKTLHVAGLGLQIFNMSNISHPEILFSMISQKRPRKVTSLALFPDSKTLIYADETLNFYDISDPTKPNLTSSYSDPEIFISSIALSKTLKKVYALALNHKTLSWILEEIDISQRDSPRSLGKYPFNSSRTDNPNIVAISPNETSIFIAKGLFSAVSENPFELIGFDLLKKQVMSQSKNFFVNTMAFVFIPGTDKVITNSINQFQITRLFRNYPNTKTFCLTNNSGNAFQFSEKVKFIAPSQDFNTLFALSLDAQFKVGSFESYNFTNKASSSPLQLLSSVNFDLPLAVSSDVQLIIQDNSAFIQNSDILSVFNISDPTKITPQGEIPQTGIQNLFHSPKEKLFLTITVDPDSQESEAKIIDYSDMSSIIGAPLPSFPNDAISNWACFSEKRKTLFLFNENIMIYNISDSKAPKLVSSQPLIFLEELLILLPMTFSTDEKTLFIIMIDQNQLTYLYTIDVSDLNNVKVLSVLDLPKIVEDSGKQPLILSRDMKRGFLVTDKNILVVDLKNLTAPVVVGMVSLGIFRDKEVSNFFMSPDEKIGYLSGFEGELLEIGLDIPYTVYLQQEKFFLGKRYSDSLLFLQSNDSTEFDLMDSSEYKIIKLLSYNFQIMPTLTAPTFSYSSLPSWISFDYENQFFSVESKKQSDLGSYTLYSISSKKIPLQVFNSTLPASIISSDVITTLISLGYVDNQQFLTSSFGSYEKFLLPSQYWNYSKIIYSTLLSYRIETFTDFEILPSLKLSTPENKRFSIITPSNYSVKVDIKLRNSNEAKAEFLQRNYGTLRPIITDHKSRLTIEGPLDAINQAFKDLVINLNPNNYSSCSGEITINDKMNPPITQSYQNISAFFFKNEAPKLNPLYPLTLQQQIDQAPLYTGQPFIIQINPETFVDNHSDILVYEIVQPSSDKKVNMPPSWLTLQDGLIMKGTPPEDFFHREVQLVLIVKNEFKQMEVPFVLNIKISLLFSGKLLAKYAPYILGIVGLIVSANKIYSILMKKRYRHPKDFYVKAGEEITSSVVFPIKFIKEEKIEGEMILKNLLLSENSDEAKIREAIKEIANGLNSQAKEKLKLYFEGDFGKKRVEQYIINNVIMQQLDATEEKATKNLFENVKEDWVEFIEYENNSFKVNETRLEALLLQKQERRNQLNNDLAETFNDSLLSENGPEINFILLQKALIVYASRKHEIDYLERKVDIEVKRKTERNFLWRFLKRDLERIPYSEKSRMVYGINYRIQSDALYISGTPDENFVGKTLVLQIISKRQRVLKELWIYGVSSSVSSENKEKAENVIGPQVIDKSYEVF